MSTKTPLLETRPDAREHEHAFGEPVEFEFDDGRWNLSTCDCGAVLVELSDDPDLTEIALADLFDEVDELRAERRALGNSAVLAFPHDYPVLAIVLPWEDRPWLFSTVTEDQGAHDRLMDWLAQDVELLRLIAHATERSSQPRLKERGSDAPSS